MFIKKEKTKLSPATLNLLEECPRCFWLALRKKVVRPRGPMPSVATGLDSAITRYFHYYRQKKQLPPFLQEALPKGRLVNEELFDLRFGIKAKWLIYEEEAQPFVLLGKLDDCLVEEDKYAPLDYKTRASPPGEIHPSYQLQMDIYTFLLENNKEKPMPVNNRAYLLYFTPRFLKEGETAEVIDVLKAFPFEFTLKSLHTNPDRVKEVLSKAMEIISSEKPPQPGKLCEFSRWAEDWGKVRNLSRDEAEKEKIAEEDDFDDGLLFR
ncbi:MAG: PD-(D/E)XK nuclease family protein [Candidatus Omnitrophica bacterium]|nr:PD-(D/E)XK nuclease family protein [Candidatus Omnitrophota bacterium]